MKHHARKGINKQFIKLIAPTVILIISFVLSAYYLSSLSGEASGLPQPESPQSSTSTQTSTSTGTATTSATSPITTTSTVTPSVPTSETSSSTSTVTTTTSSVTGTQSTTSSPTSSTTSNSAVPSGVQTTTQTPSGNTRTPTKTIQSISTQTSAAEPTPDPTTSDISPYPPGSAEDTVYKGIIIQVNTQDGIKSDSKISIHISAPIPFATNGYDVTAEIYSSDPIVIPTKVANGKIDIDITQYVSPGNHELYIKYIDPKDTTVLHTIIRKFIVNRVEAASALNASQFDVSPASILEILNPIYIYLIATMVIVAITIMFIIYKSHDSH